MGSLVVKFTDVLSPVEENHRVVGVNGNSSSVDGVKNYDLCSLLEWCRGSGDQSHPLLTRKFVDVSKNKEEISHNDEGQSFRIMQWNILADALCSGKDNFIKCPQDAKSWELRKMQILQEILTYSPDIICLQEVDHFEDFFRVQLNKVGYRGAFLPKPWSPCLDVQNNNGPDGCAIFFNTEKFELLDFKGVTLKTMTFWTNHVALFHHLKLKESGDQFLVGTTHLKAKVGYETLRVSQGKDILRYLVPYAQAGVPILLCGDFNATPDELVYQLIRECKEPSFGSAYTLLNKYKNEETNEASEPPYTTWCIRPTGEKPKTVDYVFFSNNCFSVNKILEMPSAEAIGPNRLPSFNYPSDHLSLVCDLTLLHRKIFVSEDSTLTPKI